METRQPGVTFHCKRNRLPAVCCPATTRTFVGWKMRFLPFLIACVFAVTQCSSSTNEPSVKELQDSRSHYFNYPYYPYQTIAESYNFADEPDSATSAEISIWYNSMMGYDTCGEKDQLIDCLVFKGWSFKEITIEEVGNAEKKFDRTIDSLQQDGRLDPYLILQKQIRAKMSQDDILMAYSSPEKSWNSLAGVMGYAIVRDGKVILEFETVIN
jgi:hypothetical protein